MRVLAIIGALAIVVAIGAAVYFFGGFYSVAGTVEDPAVVHWALVKVRTASIERHATDQPPAKFGEPAMVQAGAREYAEHGCTTCHGGPGVNWAKFSEGLHPDPPDLKEVVGERHAVATVLGDQERHQHDRHAELRGGRRERRRHLGDRRLPQAIAQGLGGRLQGLDRACAARGAGCRTAGRRATRRRASGCPGTARGAAQIGD